MFFFPAASHVEKEGTFTQTERMLQWREKAVEPAGDQTLRAVVRLPPGPDHPGAAGGLDRRARPADRRAELGLRQEHGDERVWGEPAPRTCCAGSTATTCDTRRARRRLPGPAGRRLHLVGLLDLLRGVQGRGEPVRAAAATAPTASGAGCWPLDRRVLYNRASADPAGTAVERAQEAGLVGRGRPALGGRRHPRLPRRPAARITCRRRTRSARPRCAATTRSCCRPTARRGCSRPTGWSTARCRRTTSPTSRRCATRCTGRGRARPAGATARARQPGQPGGRQHGVPVRAHRVPAHRAPTPRAAMSRWLPFLAELQPELFVEVSPQLAAERGLTHGEWCHVVTSRDGGAGPVVVTERIRPLRVQGQVVHQVWMPYHFGHARAGHRRRDERPARHRRRPEREHPGEQGGDLRRPAGPAADRPRAAGLRRGLPPAGRDQRGGGAREQQPVRSAATTWRATPGTSTTRRASGSSPTPRSASAARPARWRASSGTSVPAGEHLDLLGMSHDNTGDARAPTPGGTWRSSSSSHRPPVRDLGHAGATPWRGTGAETRTDFRWLMASDVCKHCTHAGCLDVCPTGALFRTEFGTVVVQQDICNGCGYCVSACPYGVIERRPGDGRAQKCTLCYDRLHDGLEPACAKACPTESIQFGELDELRERAAARVATLHERGETERPALRRRPGRRRRRQRRVLPAARRAGGVRAAAGPGRAHPGHGGGCGVRRRGRRGFLAAAVGAFLGRRAVSGLRANRSLRLREAPTERSEGCGEQAREAARSSSPRGRPDSYYGRPILKPPAWDWRIPAYLFAGGLSAGSTLLVRRRRPHRAARAAPPRAGSPRWPRWARAPTSWSPTWAARCGSTTCCGWPSRPRR